MNVLDDALFRFLLAHACHRITGEAHPVGKTVVRDPRGDPETVTEVVLYCHDCGVTLSNTNKNVLTTP